MKPQLTSPDVAVIPVLFQVPWMNCWAWTWLDLMMFYQELLMMWKTLISLHIICTGDTSMIHQSFWPSSEVMTKLVITWDTIGDNNSNDNINIVLLFFDFSYWFQLFCSEDHIFVSCTQLSQLLEVEQVAVTAKGALRPVSTGGGGVWGSRSMLCQKNVIFRSLEMQFAAFWASKGVLFYSLLFYFYKSQKYKLNRWL